MEWSYRDSAGFLRVAPAKTQEVFFFMLDLETEEVKKKQRELEKAVKKRR